MIPVPWVGQHSMEKSRAAVSFLQNHPSPELRKPYIEDPIPGFVPLDNLRPPINYNEPPHLGWLPFPLRLWGSFLWGRQNWNHTPQPQSYRPFGSDDSTWEDGDVEDEPDDYDEEIGDNVDDPNNEISEIWTDTDEVFPAFIDEVEEGIAWVYDDELFHRAKACAPMESQVVSCLLNFPKRKVAAEHCRYGYAQLMSCLVTRMFPQESAYVKHLAEKRDIRAWEAKTRLLDRAILEMKRRDYQSVEEYDFYMRAATECMHIPVALDNFQEEFPLTQPNTPDRQSLILRNYIVNSAVEQIEACVMPRICRKESDEWISCLFDNGFPSMCWEKLKGFRACWAHYTARMWRPGFMRQVGLFSTGMYLLLHPIAKVERVPPQPPPHGVFGEFAPDAVPVGVTFKQPEMWPPQMAYGKPSGHPTSQTVT